MTTIYFIFIAIIGTIFISLVHKSRIDAKKHINKRWRVVYRIAFLTLAGIDIYIVDDWYWVPVVCIIIMTADICWTLWDMLLSCYLNNGEPFILGSSSTVDKFFRRFGGMQFNLIVKIAVFLICGIISGFYI